MSDSQLLERFVSGDGEAAESAFDALVSRHGPMVFDICRKALGDFHDAQDAYQATFLVLATRAGSIRRHRSVASWLYGVALRVASHARSDTIRRRVRERQIAAMATTEVGQSPPEDQHGTRILHEEVERLPRKYREAVVLCYLEGMTQERAAEHLGCPVSTLGVRLMRARERLKARLSRRGVTVPAALLVAGLSTRSAAAATPNALVGPAVTTAIRFTSNGAVSLVVAELTRAVLRRMIMIQMARACAAVLIGVALAGLSGVVVARSGLLADDPNAGRPGPAAAPPQAARPAVESPAVFLARGGPQRTGSISAGHALEHPVVKWIFPTGGDPGMPLLADGVIYVGDRDEVLHAIRLADGSELWRDGGLGHVYFAPARRGETIYVSSINGLTALSQKDGKVLWNRKFPGSSVESSPLIVNDRIIVADTYGAMYAVGLDGEIIWEHDLIDDERARLESAARARRVVNPGPPFLDVSRPRTAASDGTTIFQPMFDRSRHLLAIDLASGKRRWSFEARGMIYGEPAVAGDRVFFGTRDEDSFVCIDKRRKTVLWTFPVESRVEAGAAYRDGSVFFGSCDGRFYRVNAETGKPIWSYQTPKAPGVRTDIYSAPVFTEDAVYFGSFDGHLYCLRIDSGELKWRIEPVKGSAISNEPLIDGQRIMLAIRRSPRTKQGRDAIVVIGEDERRK